MHERQASPGLNQNANPYDVFGRKIIVIFLNIGEYKASHCMWIVYPQTIHIKCEALFINTKTYQTLKMSFDAAFSWRIKGEAGLNYYVSESSLTARGHWHIKSSENWPLRG